MADLFADDIDGRYWYADVLKGTISAEHKIDELKMHKYRKKFDRSSEYDFGVLKITPTEREHLNNKLQDELKNAPKSLDF